MSIQLTKSVHPSWHPLLQQALAAMAPAYLQQLQQTPTWLPGPQKLFNAFGKPIDSIKTILLGESPYPRAASANGYAFWDDAVTDLWSTRGLAKPVNRATSLRNFIKMLLVSGGLLDQNTSQPAIAELNKTQLVQTLPELFNHMQQHGFLLLNASLVLSENPVKTDAKAWQPFMRVILAALSRAQPITCLLLGKIAADVQTWLPASCRPLVAEHPYNISFIHNQTMQNFFGPLRLLEK